MSRPPKGVVAGDVVTGSETKVAASLAEDWLKRMRRRPRP
jgi:hypothetical protein